MEIEIYSKKNNPLLNRTEVHFTIQHEGEKTPNREIIRSELAEKLNAKKENVIINDIQSSSGIQKSMGYAKIYSSLKKAEELERKHILIRNKISVKKEKTEEEKTETSKEPPKEEEKPAEEKPAEEKQAVEKPAEEKE